MKSDERRHYGLAVSCARRFQGRGVPMEELISEAEAALLWAASRFDPERGTRFSTYAIPFALGALRDLCRRAQPMHVPRQDVRLLAAAEAARARLREACGREPGVEDIAGAVGADAEQLSQMLAARDRMSAASGALDPALAAGSDGFEDWVLLVDVIRSLPRPYAQVVWLRCGAGLSQAEIARRFQVGQPQISRWEKQGRELLQTLLQSS